MKRCSDCGEDGGAADNDDDDCNTTYKPPSVEGV